VTAGGEALHFRATREEVEALNDALILPMKLKAVAGSGR
jgi:hypothetical protein